MPGSNYLFFFNILIEIQVFKSEWSLLSRCGGKSDFGKKIPNPPLCRNSLLTVAAGAPFRARSGFTAGAAAARAIVQDADVHLLVDAACRLLEGQVDVVLLGSEVELLLLAGGLTEVSERTPSTVTENCPRDRINLG
jgi:hypothetical protein